MKTTFNVMNDDELLGSESSVKAIHREVGIVPLLAQPDAEILDLRATQIHQSRLMELQQFLVLVENPQDVNEITAPKILAQLSYGFRKSGEFLAAAKYAYANARAERKRAAAIAALDNIRDYVAQKKAEGLEMKITDATREHYIQIDPEVKRTTEIEALYDAMQEQLSTIKMEFLMAISTTKAIAYGHRDSNMISGASVSVNDKE